MGHVVISYSAKDELYARKLKELLNQNGVDTWFAPDDIKPGNVFGQQFVDAIDNAEIFLFIISPSSISAWREKELEYALTAKKSGINIVPVAFQEHFNSIYDVYEQLNKNNIFNYYLSSKQLIYDSVENVAGKLSSDINRKKRIKELYKNADEAWMYGSYEQAYNFYMTLVSLETEVSRKQNCQSRAADCCVKGNKLEEALELYKLAGNIEGEKQVKSISSNRTAQKDLRSNDSDDRILFDKIATYCDASIDLFNELLKDNRSPDGLNCLRTSYFRLMNYCKSIGNMDKIIATSLSKLKEIERKSKEIKMHNKNSSEVIKSYRTYLGLEFPQSDNYDVFISYKSEDEMLARRVYDFLLSEGKRVFLACEALPDMGRTEYRDAIMDALDHSQHFVLVTSQLDYMIKNWVKEEWSFFVNKLIEDGHIGNLVLVMHDDFEVDKNQLPQVLRFKQRVKMSEFREKLPKYLWQ